MLTTASVVGREFDLRLMTKLMDGLSEDQLLDALDEALAARKIEEISGTPGRPILEGAVGPFYPTLRLRRTREDLLHPKLCHRTTELGRRRRLMRARYILEDGVAVTVQGQRNPTTPDQLLHEEEIAMSVLFMAKQCVGHGAGGIIDCQQQVTSRQVV